MTRNARNARSLDELYAILTAPDFDNDSCKLDDLPTFGGAEPRDTDGVYSWDETRVLIGGEGPWEICDRNDEIAWWN